MKNWPFAASYERGIALVDAGCPIDYPEVLPRGSAVLRKRFRAAQLSGYLESRVYALNPSETGYLLALRLRSDSSTGTIISDWRFVPPWPDPLISWDYEPSDIIPEGHRHVYSRLFKSKLMEVLDEGRLLRRGYPIDGLLCGRSFQPIKESVQGLVSAKLILQDDMGNTATVRLRLSVSHPPVDRWRARTAEAS